MKGLQTYPCKIVSFPNEEDPNIDTPQHDNPHYRDPKNDTPNFWETPPHIVGAADGTEPAVETSQAGPPSHIEGGLHVS